MPTRLALAFVLALGALAPSPAPARSPVTPSPAPDVAAGDPDLDPWVPFIIGDSIYIYYKSGLIEIYEWNPVTQEYEQVGWDIWEGGLAATTPRDGETPATGATAAGAYTASFAASARTTWVYRNGYYYGYGPDGILTIYQWNPVFGAWDPIVVTTWQPAPIATARD